MDAGRMEEAIGCERWWTHACNGVWSSRTRAGCETHSMPYPPMRSMLEASHSKIVHLAKLADVQTIHHGVPLHDLGARGLHEGDAPLPPREEALVAFSQMLFAFHLDPAWADKELTATLMASAAASTGRGGTARLPTPAQMHAMVDDAMLFDDVPRPATARASRIDSASEEGAAPAFNAGAQSFAVERPAAAAAAAASAGRANDDAQPAPASAPRGGRGNASGSAARGARGGAARSAATARAAPPPPPPQGAGAPTLAASRSKWSVDEIALFEQGLERYGEHAPTMIARLVGTRTGEQVRERIRTARKRAAKNMANAAAAAAGH